jgi:hypothetical protein
MLFASVRLAGGLEADGMCGDGSPPSWLASIRADGNTWSLSSKRRPSASRILRFVSIRQFMPFSTLWIVRSATFALRASWACVISRFSRSSRTRFMLIAFERLLSMRTHPLRSADRRLGSTPRRAFRPGPGFL